MSNRVHIRSCLGSLLWVVAFSTLGLVAFSCSLFLWIEHRMAPYEYTTASIPTRTVGIVFGASVRSNHTLSPILKDRVDGAILLYREGKIQTLLMTGDNSRVDYNEVTAMQNYAIEQGIPNKAIALDHAGFNTYDSCYRAQAIFQVHQAILITQQYHLHRALYTCRNLGIDAIGLALPDFQLYPDLRWPYTAREVGADLKAWLQVKFIHPNPRFLGSPLPIPN